jgi:hypothetical protein
MNKLLQGENIMRIECNDSIETTINYLYILISV